MTYGKVSLMSKKSTRSTKVMLLAGLLAGSIVVSMARTQAAQGKQEAGQATLAGSPSAPSPKPGTSASFSSARRSARGDAFYKQVWGIDNVVVRETSSGLMVRFSYRVVDATKAKVLNDKKATPYLIEEKTGAALQVPMMEKVGQLRQTATPKNGREYWMVFANKGEFVKPGSRVDIVIGNFRVNGLVVE